MKPRVLVVVCSFVVACAGLLTDQGNDFPCDFSRPPGERDAVCSAGDVCGVDNHCRRYRYEGPQFEGKPTFPVFTDAGKVLHPTVLTGPIDFVTRSPRTTITGPSGPAVRESVVFARSGSSFFAIDGPFITTAPISTELTDVVVVTDERNTSLIGRSPRGGLAVQRVPALPVMPTRPVMPPVDPVRLRAFEVDGEAVVIAVGPETGQITVDPPTFTRWPADAGVLDVAPGPLLAPRLRAGVTLLTRAGLAFRLRDGGIEPVGEPFPVEPGAVLATDPSGSVYAVIRQAGVDPGILSTFEVQKTGATFEVRQPWNDCTPCRPARLPFALTPGQDGEGPFVDVLCPEGLQRVRGAAGLVAKESCESETKPVPFDFAQLGRRSVGTLEIAQQDIASPVGVLAGGRQGQLWSGATLSTALPSYLDRVPVDFERIAVENDTGDALAMVAITSAGIFLRPEDPALAQRTNGFVRIDTPGLGATRLAALVHESLGWAVLSSGDLFFFRPSFKTGLASRDGRDAGVLPGFGPRLVDGRGEPVSRVLRGEAINDFDGRLVSMVVAADDSLYFVPAPDTTATPGNLGSLTPQVTPEPSSLIRSLALERTPIGTDGVSRVRGYVVTSRNVYEFKLGGVPLQWTTTPLRLSGGEPVEVWFDNPRGGLARAGYRDGTIFTIPGGFQLTEALPASDGGVSVVIDYENLAGWPVALTTTGLYVARYDANAEGRLDNRFPDGGVNKPMRWREVTLPDGSRPWLERRRVEGALQVLAEPEADGGAGYRRLFRLLVYLPDQVLEVGTHERTNASALLQ